MRPLEALLIQMQVEPWLDGAASSALLGMTPEELQTQLWDCTLPAMHGSEG